MRSFKNAVRNFLPVILVVSFLSIVPPVAVICIIDGLQADSGELRMLRMAVQLAESRQAVAVDQAAAEYFRKGFQEGLVSPDAKDLQTAQTEERLKQALKEVTSLSNDLEYQEGLEVALRQRETRPRNWVPAADLFTRRPYRDSSLVPRREEFQEV